MTRYLKTALLAAAALLASCIHNDIPYPVVELRIASVEGQGFSVSENNVTSRTVTLSLDEATDIRNVRIDAVGYDAVIHSIQLDKEEVLQQIRSSRELTGTFDLRSPIYTTLSLYQDYEWTIRATQTIERRFSVTGQIGATEIEEKNRIARVLVPSDTDLAHIEVTELKLGPADITTYSPSLEELSGSSFAPALSASALTVLARVCSLLSFLLMLVRGMYGKWLYRRSAASRIRRIQSEFPDARQRQAVLRAQGGVSFGAVFLCILLLTLGGSLFTLLLGPDLQALFNAFYG